MRTILLSALVLSATAFAANPHNGRLEAIAKAKVIIVRGSADHMEQVLAKAKADFVTVEPAELPELPLNAKQVLMVNCRGEMSDAARERVRRFVAAGGFLYTTDHAVHELVEKIFPNTIAWTGTTTNQEVLPVKVRGTDEDRGLLNSLGGNAKEFWQVAGGGYPVKVLDPKRVTVLMESKEVAQKYGSGTIAVRFRYEDGQVIHVTGHFYSQPGQQGAVASAGRGFETFSANVVQEKSKDVGRIDSLYDAAPKREVQLQVAPAATAAPAPTMGMGGATKSSGERLKVLEKKSDFTRVRDQQGNEGWVPTDAL